MPRGSRPEVWGQSASTPQCSSECDADPMEDESLISWAVETAESLVRPLDRRWRHVQGVASRAERFAQALPAADQSILIASAWLHDVGYAPAIALTGFHPLDGARFLEREGFPATVVQLVAYHSGAEVEAEERGLLHQLAEFPIPPDDLLARLTAVDMTTTPDGEEVPARQRIDEILTRYESPHPVFRAVTRSGLSLIETAERVQAQLGA